MKTKVISVKGKGPRKQMQDFGSFEVFTQKEIAWFMVSDGIGGYPGGREAASICTKTLHKHFKKTLSNDFTGNLANMIKMGLVDVSEAFHMHIGKNPKHLFMGCTICGVVINGDQQTVFWTGDSRVFQFRGSKCIFRSIPHNPVFEEYKAGTLTLQQAEQRQTNLITRTVDAGLAIPFVETASIRIRSKDRLVIASDGLWNAFTVKELNTAFCLGDLVSVKANFESYLSAQAKDNYFGYLVEVV